MKTYLIFLQMFLFTWSILITYTLFFVSSTFVSSARLKLAKNQANAKQRPEAELLLFKDSLLSSFTSSFKNSRRHSKKCTKNEYLCLNVLIWLMAVKMRLNMKNRSHRYDINRPSPRHGHSHTEYKMCLSIMMVICIKQHLSNIWGSIHEKVKSNTEAEFKKSVAYKKSV